MQQSLKVSLLSLIFLDLFSVILFGRIFYNPSSKEKPAFSGGISRDRGLLIEGEEDGTSPDERWMKLG